MIYELRNLIAGNKFDEVVSKLLRISDSNKDDDMNHLVFCMKGRLNELICSNIKGIITYQDGAVTLNQIRSEFLNFIKTHSDEISKFSAPPPPKMHTYADFDPILSELAHELTSNYFIVSFGDDTQMGYNRPDWKAIFETTAQFEQKIEKKRNILIVGAGATYSACPYLPYGRQLSEYLLLLDKDLYQKGDDEYHRLYPMFDVETYLSEQSGLKPDERALLEVHLKETHKGNFDIENYLSVLDSNLEKADKPKLRADLQKIYNKRYLPTHTYEIIAHLFKHRFIDIIINFNFDELLDQAIEEELGKSDYHKILHEGDCEPLSHIMIDGRLKTPIYIKIHGTASVMNSMQFTKNHHLQLPAQMKQFIEKWVYGYVDDAGEQNRIPVNLITLGFDLERARFSEYLKEHQEPKKNLVIGSKLFQINWKKDAAARVGNIEKYYQQTNGQKRHIQLADWDKIKDKEDANLVPMADFWTRLWEKHLVPLFKPLFKPRSIARHQMVADIFYHGFKTKSHSFYRGNLPALKAANERFNGYFSSTAYFFERTVVEIAITLANNKGIIEPLEAIKQDRIGTFYNEYKKQLPIAAARKNELEKKIALKIAITELEKSEMNVFNAKRYCTEYYTLQKIYTDCFKMEEKFSFSNHLFNLSIFPNTAEKKVPIHFGFVKKLGCEACNKETVHRFLNKHENLHLLIIYRFYQSNINNDLWSILDREGNYLLTRLSKALSEIRDGFSYNITPKFRDHTVYAFESARRRDILHTNLALSYQFETIFSNPDEWDILLLISERGNFLARHIKELPIHNEIKSKPILLIGCHEAIAEDWHEPTLYDTKPSIMKKLSKAYLKGKNLEAHKQLKLHFLPYWRHHHHVAIFLKVKMQSELSEQRKHFQVGKTNDFLEVAKSIYYFKQGFSNKINPLLVPTEAEGISLKEVEADQIALMDKFIAHYMKAVYFGVTGNSIAVVNQDLSFEYEEALRDEHYTETKDAFFKYLMELHQKNP